MTQEHAFLKAQHQLHELVAFVHAASDRHERVDQVERGLFDQLLQLGHSLLTAFVAAAGNGDEGATLPLPDGTTCRRLDQPHARTYRSLFGPLTIERFVYGVREGQAIQAVPLDARLGLPAGEFSYVLEDWAQRLCTQGAFAEVARTLEQMLGVKPSVRSLEHMNQALAEFTGAFHAEQAPPPADEEGELLVLTADGKGVPMRRPAPPHVRSAPHRRGKGEKANKKQMAYVGAVYSIGRYVRTADDVLDEVCRQQRQADRPRPCHKEVWAEMTQVIDGASCNGRVTLFDRLAEAWQRRDPAGAKVVVCLLDGERALWDARQESWAGSVGILDLFHVLERLWQVAHCFCAEGSVAAERFVHKRLRKLLEGKVGSVIRGLRRRATVSGLTGSRRRTVRTVCGYYRNNRAHMKYDEYLAAGYPIGSGVAEGACRHLVKDRLECTGMRWTVPGAQAMLHLRATFLNGDWDAFVACRIREEQERLYGSSAAEPQYALAT